MTDLRTTLKTRRDALSAPARLLRSQRAALHLRRWLSSRQLRHVGAYLSHKGEMPTAPIVRVLALRRLNIYLPALDRNGLPRLHFLAWQPRSPLLRNRFGIKEPAYQARRERQAKRLDLVLLPLLGFDSAGHRLGMGGGFYDRTFAFLLKRPPPKHRPYLLGIALNVQKVARLPQQAWDVPLDAVLTESGIQEFRQRSQRKKRM